MYVFVALSAFIYFQMNIWSVSPAASKFKWTYKDQKGWCKNLNIKNTCCGKQQSPVDITTKGLQSTKMNPFKFTDYGTTPGTLPLANNGHTIAVLFDNFHPKVEGGGLPHVYNLYSLHMHWAGNDKFGSEHTVDGKSTSLELHLVHVHEKYATPKAALASREPDAIAVLGVLYEINDGKASAAFHTITSKLNKVQYKKESSKVQPFELRKLLPENTNEFFRYSGSLTTPNCSEAVVWTVFKAHNYLSKSDIAQVRNLVQNEKGENEHEKLVDNFRQTQALNGRKIILGDTKA